MPRYTQQSEHIFQSAKEIAKRMRSTEVNCGHLLLALLGEQSGLAYHVLKNHGLLSDMVLDLVKSKTAIVADGTDLPDDLPFSDMAEAVTKEAEREAIALQHNYVGTEHILLALAFWMDPPYTLVLRRLNLDEWALRHEVLELLGHASEKKTASCATLRFRRGDLCAFKCAGGAEPVLIQRDVGEMAAMAPIGNSVSTSVDNLFFLCHTQYTDYPGGPRELVKCLLPEIVSNLASMFISLRDALNYPKLAVIRNL